MSSHRPWRSTPRCVKPSNLIATQCANGFRGVESVHFGPPISDDFVRALRAGAGAGELAIAAALPLVTVAAHLGELELLYPEPVSDGAGAHSAAPSRTGPR